MDHVHQKLGYCFKIQFSGLNLRPPNLEPSGGTPERERAYFCEITSTVERSVVMVL